MNEPDEFWARVDRSGGPDACWPYTGGINGAGYGSCWWRRRYMDGHCVAWSIANGPIARGVVIRHTCDNRKCCNPTHLLSGTHHDNAMDKIRRGRDNPRRGSRHRAAKLNENQVREIRRRNAAGEGQRALGREFGLSSGSMNKVVSGKTWRHVS